MADQITRVSMLMRESLAAAVVNLTDEQDDIMWTLSNTFPAKDSAGRDTDSEVGAGASDYFAEWRVKVQNGGTLEGADFGGTTMIQAGAYNELFMGQSLNKLYPDPALAALESYIKVRMKLRRVKGLIPLSKDEILAELITTPIEKVAMDAVISAVRLFRGNFTSQAWGDGGAALARFDGGGTIAEGSVTFFAVKAGTPFRFIKGQKYVAGSHVANADFGGNTRTARTGNGAGANTPSIFFCTGVNKNNRKVGFESKAGEGTITITDGDSIMLYNMFDFTQSTVTAGSRAMEGVESLLIKTGDFPGAKMGGTQVTVDNVTELQAFIDGDETALEIPTPELIAELIDLMTDGGKMPPPVVIAEQSLWTLWAQQERMGVATYQLPAGGTFPASGGVSGPLVSHGANTFTRMSSNQCREGSISGIAPNSMLKFMPLGGNTIKWFFSGGGVSGAGSIFGPTYSGRQVSELSQAPFDGFGQMGCSDPGRNFRRIGLYSQRSLNGVNS